MGKRSSCYLPAIKGLRGHSTLCEMVATAVTPAQRPSSRSKVQTLPKPLLGRPPEGPKARRSLKGKEAALEGGGLGSLREETASEVQAAGAETLSCARMRQGNSQQRLCHWQPVSDVDCR